MERSVMYLQASIDLAQFQVQNSTGVDKLVAEDNLEALYELELISTLGMKEVLLD